MSAVRKMAVIMAGDVVGYSRLVGADEEGTVARLKALQRELVRPKIAAHRGRIFKTTGDGMLAEFASVVDALRYAAEVQLAMRERGAGVPENQRIVFRIGINLGDVIVDGDDLLGDGVNVAARVEGLCAPGGIAITLAVREHAIGKLPLIYEDQGEHQVKNIAKPVRVYAVRFDDYVPEIAKARRFSWLPQSSRRVAFGVTAATALVAIAAIAWWQWPRQPAAPAIMAAPAATAPAVAERAALIVLPFTNISDDPSQEYFSDGFTEDLTTALARVPGLLVLARNTAFTYKGKAVDAQQVGRELGVRYVLEGSVRKAGDRLRMNAQLIEAATGNHVWAEKYDRQMAEVFVVQDELADRIVGSVTSQLRRREGERALRASRETLEAYELTMRARAVYNQGGRDNTFEARRLAQQAIEQDPSFASAYVLYAITMNSIYSNRWNEEFGTRATAERMAMATAKAVSLAPADALAHAIHGFSMTILRQFDTAIAEAEHALDLAPNDADVLAFVGVLLNRTSRYESTVQVVRKAVALDPYISTTTVGSNLGGALYLLGRYSEGAEATRSCVQRAPSSTLCWTYLIAALGQMKPASEIRNEVAELLKVSPGFTVSADKARRLTTFRNADDVEKIADGLRKAGVPE